MKSVTRSPLTEERSQRSSASSHAHSQALAILISLLSINSHGPSTPFRFHPNEPPSNQTFRSALPSPLPCAAGMFASLKRGVFSSHLVAVSSLLPSSPLPHIAAATAPAAAFSFGFLRKHISTTLSNMGVEIIPISAGDGEFVPPTHPILTSHVQKFAHTHKIRRIVWKFSIQCVCMRCCCPPLVLLFFLRG